MACSSSGDNAREAPAGGPIVWTDAGRHWVSQPQTSGGRFVAYLERAGQLFVAAIDPNGGEPVWELPASASSLTPGVVLHLAHDDQHVYFGGPVDAGGTGDTVFVVAVDAASGVEVWRTGGGLHLTSNLSTCDDDDTMLCATSVSRAGGHSLRIAKATGALTHEGLPKGTRRQLGHDLYDLGGRDPEVIAAIDPTGRTLWTKTARELFQGRPVASDYGWDWRRHDDLLVGWLGRIDADRSTTDLSESSITSVDAATGEVVWVVDGVSLDCGLAGADLPPGPAPLRCRRTGIVTRDENGEHPVVTGLNVVLEQFDPTTGESLWEADLGAAESLILGEPPLIRLSSTEIVVGRQDDSSLGVDVASGQTRVPAPGDTGWCSGENMFPDVRSYLPTKDRRGQDFVTPCRLDRSPIDALAPNPPPVVAVSETIHAWVDAGGMHAADSG
jgi:outer membrane protein assembly factor BamB